ncbi:reprolysin-like metallopeptidase [Flavobacterium sp.]|uniref:zinc-dependent metalloprotease n=1 Tax=Flavobacterium sp. TaxID=239 RepID=UPI0025C12395|nr:zinc-dependent metalloprotease family protein [Flavobacterium sp.]MBA4155351.1 propanediol utilization protein [Flavobacterium sp.]
MKKTLLLILLTAFTFTSGMAQADKFWVMTKESVSEVSKTAQREDFPAVSTMYRLNTSLLKQTLMNAADRFSGNSSVVVTMPNALGEMERFQMYEASNFEPALQAQFPEIRAYIGIGLDDPKAQLRMSVDPKGIQTMTFRAGQRTEFMEPYAADGSVYAFYVSTRTKGKLPFTCSTAEHSVTDRLATDKDINVVEANNLVLKTFRLALSCTGEYTTFHGGNVAGALAAMNATMTRVNGVFEKDFAVRMNIIANNSAVIYTNAATDPYADSAQMNLWNAQLQSTLTSVIGEANYDVGHLFGATGGGGNAGCIGCVCVDGQKGSGITSPADGVPAGDTYDIDYVAHELGHQFGANHTFSHAVEGSGVNIEPGSGSTIMGYAGITNYNVQGNSDDYFAYRSILQVQTNLLNKTCPISTPLTNPALTVTSGGNWTIPQGTAFILTGTNPTNNPGATFTWEQNNNANSSVTGAQSVCFPTKSVGPNFRSVIPTATPVRYMPAFSSVLNNSLSTTWESVSTIQRILNFTLTARDNIANGGQTNTASTAITVNAAVGPFTVTSQNSSTSSWAQGSTQTITWNVNNTNTLVGSTEVDILLSTDSGATFSTVLAAATPNDGSQDIVVPNVLTQSARIMIRPTGNIYYALNGAFFPIGYTCSGISNSTSAAITDGLGANLAGPTTVSNIVSTESGDITSIEVTVNVTHSWIGDLVIALVHPDGTSRNLWNRTCNNPQNGNINVTFKDGAGTIVCGTPTSGTYSPIQSLAPFLGKPKSGNWSLRLTDFYNGDTGTLNSWSINFGCTLGKEDFSLQSLVVYPNPSKGNFNVSFDNAASESVNISVFDIRGRKIFENDYQGGSNFNQNIQLNNAQPGVYLLNVTDGERKEVKRIIVE